MLNIVISGASRGIGKEIAYRAAKNSANIAFTYNSNTDSAMEVRTYIENLGCKCLCEKVDIADYNACKQFAGHVEGEFGQIDVIINNAGITKDNNFILMKESEWLDVVNVNLTGFFNFTKAFIFSFMKRKQGGIINISSVSGIIGMKQQTNYAASKAGVIGFTKSLAKELAPYNIKVNAVAPGFIATDMLDKLDDKLINQFISDIPLGRIGDANEVAEFVNFLVNGGDSYITGQVFAIDGGLSI